LSGICINDFLRDCPFGNAPVHSLLFDVAVRLRLVHLHFADKQQFCAAYNPDFGHFFFKRLGVNADLILQIFAD
jgi:hypothetical protein